MHYSESADIYSLAIVFWEMLTREDPYKGMEPFFIIYGVSTQGLRPKIPPSCPKEFAALITTMWQDDRNDRPTVDEVLVAVESLQFPKTPHPAEFKESKQEARKIRSDDKIWSVNV